jgi:hypothetical protein
MGIKMKKKTIIFALLLLSNFMLAQSIGEAAEKKISDYI